ncbi:hypothetical protein TNCV_4576751 [Trichonephila clavipes]|nr:hypothetical protein TNCV_4576751 [Trichonephila clavipes]
MTQSMHVEDFLRGTIIGRLECAHTQNFKLPKESSLGFVKVSKVTEMSVDLTIQLVPELQCFVGPIRLFPKPSQPSRSKSLSERWGLIQRLCQYFRDCWFTEYLRRFHRRSELWRTQPNLLIGDKANFALELPSIYKRQD